MQERRWRTNGLAALGPWTLRFRRSPVAQNIVALYGTQIAAFAFPLATIPYLARVLGPFHWGLVAFAQAFGLYLSIVVEFGFQLSATRQVARLRDQENELAQILADVTGAKLLLTALCLAVSLVVRVFLPDTREYGLLFWAGAASGVGQGFNMLWFYQGLERMKLPAGVDIVAKAVAAGCVLVFVRQPSDAWKVLGLQAVCYGGASVVLLVLAYRNRQFRWPSLTSSWQAMRESAGMFLFRSAVSLYTTSNALILGTIGSPLAVGYYSGAEKIAKAPLSLLNPVSHALYPRLCRLMSTDRQRAASLARISLGATAFAGASMCFALLVSAPVLVRIALGPGYEPAVPVLRILSLLLPAVAVSNVLGIQWMLPLQMDVAFNQIIISAGLLNLLLAGWWASRWQHLGMAAAVVTSELAVTIAMFIILAKRNANPMRMNLEVDVQSRH